MFLLVYFIIVIYITVISRSAGAPQPVNTDLFWSYLEWAKGDTGYGIQILLNIFLFIALGFFLADACNGKDKQVMNNTGINLRFWFLPLFISFAVSAAIEAVQYICFLGFCDIDDIFSNMLGAFLGVCVYQVCLRFNETDNLQCWKRKLSSFYIAAGLLGCVISSPTLRGYVPVNQVETVLYDAYLDAVLFFAEPQVKNTDLETIVSHGMLKAYDLRFDVYVYQYERKLYWLIGTPIDKQTEIIFHLHTDEPDKLPEHRKQYKFDNRGFRPGGKNELTTTMRCGKYRVFERDMPAEYNITKVWVGFNTNGKITWNQYFQVVE